MLCGMHTEVAAQSKLYAHTEIVYTYLWVWCCYFELFQKKWETLEKEKQVNLLGCKVHMLLPMNFDDEFGF